MPFGNGFSEEEPTKIWPKECYYCHKEVDEKEHNQVQLMTDFWMNAMFDVLPIVHTENTFVHMVGVTANQMDYDGNVVVCAFDCLREMNESIERGDE